MSWMTLTMGVLDRSKKYVDAGVILFNVEDISTVEPLRTAYAMDNISYEKDVTLFTMKSGKTKVVNEPIDAVLNKLRIVIAKSQRASQKPETSPQKPVDLDAQV